MLAASNTLPDNAGYVAAAYLVFLALLLIYVGIMAYKLIKVQRYVAEINELTEAEAPAARARARGDARMSSELLCLGISHKTAPVAVRERLALTTPGGAAPLPRAGRDRRDPRGRRDLHLQPHRDLPRRRPRRRRDRAALAAGPARGHAPDRADRRDVRAAQLRRRAPALPRRLRPGVDDRRRGRDPGPGQARLRGRAGGRHDRPADQPPLHRRAADRQARALRDRRSARAGRASRASPSASRAT